MFWVNGKLITKYLVSLLIMHPTMISSLRSHLLIEKTHFDSAKRVFSYAMLLSYHELGGSW